MKVTLLSLVLLFITLATAVKWEDCGIPLTRKIYYQGVVLSPSKINIAKQTSEHSISVNVNAQIKDYTVPLNTSVSMQVYKDGEKYFDGPIGDLCQILWNANRVECPLPEASYSLSYQYTLPPLPTGNYTVVISTYEPITGKQIGCLSVRSAVIGLGLDDCSYTSTLDAVMSGTVSFLQDDTVIQIGPRGPDGVDLGPEYQWGTFKSVVASPDLVGYAFRPENYVWGLRGSINTSVSENQFDGTLVIGWRPNPDDYEFARLIYQGTFSWEMMPSDAPAYIFKSGSVTLNPPYFYPEGFPYPLNIGNLGPLQIQQDTQQMTFTISATRSWCRCNCDLGGIGKDDVLQERNKDSGLSGFEKGTIAICVIGGILLIVAIIFIVKIRRSKPRPVVYDDADLLDPQKPDYGTIAINEAFEAEEQEYN
jgi:hypothetical protein